MDSHDSATPGQTPAAEDASLPLPSDCRQLPLVSADSLTRYYRKRPARRPFSKKAAAIAAVLVILGMTTTIVMTRRNSGDAAVAKLPPAPRADADEAENRILGETQEADAPRKTIRLHNTMVRITRVEVGEVQGRDERNQVIMSEGKTFLHVYVRIQNIGTLPLEYHSWYGNAFDEAGTARVAELRDDTGHSFDMMLFSDARSIRGHVAQTTLAPKQSIQDVLIFRLREDAPLSGVGWLSLQLPALAHGDTGSYRFRIPRSMIVAQDSTAREAAAAEAGKPENPGEPQEK